MSFSFTEPELSRPEQTLEELQESLWSTFNDVIKVKCCAASENLMRSFSMTAFTKHDGQADLPDDMHKSFFWLQVYVKTQIIINVWLDSVAVQAI